MHQTTKNKLKNKNKMSLYNAKFIQVGKLDLNSFEVIVRSVSLKDCFSTSSLLT